jgi:DNA-binding response OmpR family regulator
MSSSPVPSRTTRVLVAEDDDDTLGLLNLWLTRRGYRVIATKNGTDALRLVHAERPDIVILDWVMPGEQGHEVCRKIKADPETAGIPVVMLTAKSHEEDVSTGFRVGADEYLTKPFDLSELEHLMRRVLRAA